MVVAYLDAGTGAAIAAVVASGAVGARAVAAGLRDRLRHRGRVDVPVVEQADGEAGRDPAVGGVDVAEVADGSATG